MERLNKAFREFISPLGDMDAPMPLTR